VTSGTDTPPNTYIPAALTVPVNYQVSIPPSGTLGAPSGGFGAVEFSPVDDDDLGYWAGRAFSVKLGGTYDVGLASETTLDYADYSTTWRVVCDDLEYDESTARMYVRDTLETIDAPIQSSKYLGTGGYNGTAALTGAYKPRIYGTPFNVPAVLIDDTNYIYQINDGAVVDITDVRVNGESMTDAGDTTSLSGWTGGSAGQYKTDKSRGLFRLWAQPAGTVTADAYTSTTQGGLVLLEMLNDMGIYNTDIGSFYGAMKYDIGVWIGTGAETGLDLINRIAQNSDCFVYSNRAGEIVLGTHPNVVNDMPVYTLEGRRAGTATLQNIKNVVTDNTDLSTWTQVNSPTVTGSQTDPYGGTDAWLIEDDSAVGVERITNNQTFDNDGDKVISCFIKEGTSAIHRFGIYDNTATTSRHIVKATWSGGTPTMTTDTGSGTIYEPINLGGGWYLIMMIAEGVVATNTNTYQLHPTAIASDTGTAYFAFPCAFENVDIPGATIAAPFTGWETSVIKTTGAAATGTGNITNYGYTSPNVITSIRRLPTPPAPKSLIVGYKRNWSPQDEDGLDGGLTAAQKQSYSTEYLSTDEKTNGAAVSINPAAPNIVFDGGYIKNVADAESVRDAAVAKHGGKRDLFSVEITAPLFRITPGMVVKLHYDRFQLASGKKGEVIGLIEGPTTTALDILMIE
jgi:hypothetical protein